MSFSSKLYFRCILLYFDFLFLKNDVRSDKNTLLVITPNALNREAFRSNYTPLDWLNMQISLFLIVIFFFLLLIKWDFYTPFIICLMFLIFVVLNSLPFHTKSLWKDFFKRYFSLVVNLVTVLMVSKILLGFWVSIIVYTINKC